MRFLIITYNCDICSKGFNVIEVDVKNYTSAYKIGIGLTHTSYVYNFIVIALEDKEILASRKLTFMERLTGRMKL